MDDLKEQLGRELKRLDLTVEDFQQVAVRLLEGGFLVAQDSKIEGELYQRALTMFPLLEDYFQVLGCRLHHEEPYRYIQLFPPGAEVPGRAVSADFEGLHPGMRVQLSANETALLLVLRFLYDKAWAEGGQNEAGEIELQFEAIYTAIRSLLNREPPTAQQDRLALYRRLRQLRVIKVELNDEDFDAPDKWLTVRPQLLTLVRHEAVREILQESSEAPETPDTAAGAEAATAETETATVPASERSALPDTPETTTAFDNEAAGTGETRLDHGRKRRWPFRLRFRD